ncbi:MAG: helix-turn-helix transcriptional regulator [Lachnospiraceae bacterium]|nr:helix-turn-helix transcriptional regulator [Lachnospiraceae bacterium]
MYEEIKVYSIQSFKDYGLAKRNSEELTKKISSLQLDLELDDEETSKLEGGIMELNHKLDEQKKYITEFINAQANYDSKFLSGNLDFLLKMHGLRISDLEELLGVSAGYVSRTVNPDSKKRLSVDIVWKISAIFQVNVDDLLNINFQVPTQSLRNVIDFFKKLKQETDESTIHWNNQGNKAKNYVGLFFKDLGKDESDGEKYYQYAPDGYASKTEELGLTDDFFSVETSIGELYLFPLENQFGEKGYELYRYTDRDDYDPRFETTDLDFICSTFDDRSNTLKGKCDELFKSVKLHETDFVISDSAKNLIDMYLNPKKNNAADGFMNIPDSIGEELPFN